jgi:acid phosphatase
MHQTAPAFMAASHKTSQPAFMMGPRANARNCFLFLLLAALAGCGGVTGSFSLNSANVPPSTHVFLVVLENHSFSQVMGSPSMPFLNSLATQFSVADNYFANTHPSIGNYFMLSTGTIPTNDDAFTGTVSNDNLVRALTSAGKSWKAYLQSLPSVGYIDDRAYPYSRVHNPFAYLSDVLASSAQTANLVPLSQLSADLNSGALPDFAFITPDSLNDAHDCPSGKSAVCPDTDKLAAADAWLKANIAPIISNPAFGNSVIIITWDESVDTDLTNGGGHVATILLGGRIKRGFTSSTLFQHQSTLRLIMDTLKVNHLPNAAESANTMAEFFL